MSGVGVLVGGLALLRSYVSGNLYEGKEELYGKTVVITGGSGDIAKETAKELAKRGKLQKLCFINFFNQMFCLKKRSPSSFGF